MTDKEKLDIAVDNFAASMKVRLNEKRKQGYEGWDDYATKFFARRFFEILRNPSSTSITDLANFLMMAEYNSSYTAEFTESIQQLLQEYIRVEAQTLLNKAARDV